MGIISRRLFIKYTTAATLFIGFLNPLRKLFALESKVKTPSWIELIDYARWCPTVHNLQPHRIKIISQTEAELYYDPARLLPIGDPRSIFATVAMGILVEHLSIAASCSGNKVEINQMVSPIKTGGKGITLFAKLILTPSGVTEEIDRELIKKRRTSRRHYDERPLKAETLQKIKKVAIEYGHNFSVSTDKKLVDYIIELNQQTLFEDISSKPNCQELDGLFRYNEKDAETMRDGLWSKCMCFPGSLMKMVFRNPEQWHKGLRKKILAKYYKSSFKGTTTIGWFEGSFDTSAHWLQAGRMLARNWLLITKENGYIQPFGSLITNDAAYKKINAKLTKPIENKKLWLLFRAGYSKEPARSFRLTTEEIVIK